MGIRVEGGKVSGIKLLKFFFYITIAILFLVALPMILFLSIFGTLFGFVVLFAYVWILVFFFEMHARSQFPKRVSKEMGQCDYQYVDTKGTDGIAIDKASKRMLLMGANGCTIYDFDEIREWSIRDVEAGEVFGGVGLAAASAMGANMRAKRKAKEQSGLFITVKDIDSPEWQIKMDLKNQKKWFEILNQFINEK